MSTSANSLDLDTLSLHDPAPPPPPPSPSNALAASLPAEILILILDQASEDWDSISKVNHALVCRPWYQASTFRKGYRVDTASQARRLAAWLESIGQGDSVRTLVLPYDIDDQDKVASIASLIRTCKKTTELKITPAGRPLPNGGVEPPEDRPFLDPATDEELVLALEGLENLESFTLLPDQRFLCPKPSYDRIISFWLKLRSLDHNMMFVTEDDVPEPKDLPAGLEEIFWSRSGAAPAFVDVAYPSRRSLKSITADTLYFDLRIKDRFHVILHAAAPSLERLSLFHIEVEQPGALPYIPFNLMAPKMVNIEFLELEVTCVDPPTVFDCLAKMPRLHSFTLLDLDPERTGDRIQFFKLNSLLHFLEKLPNPNALEMLELPASIELVWFGDNGGEAEGRGKLWDAAEKS